MHTISDIRSFSRDFRYRSEVWQYRRRASGDVGRHSERSELFVWDRFGSIVVVVAAKESGVARFQVLAGDFAQNSQHQYLFGALSMSVSGKWMPDRILSAEIKSVESVTEENKHRVGRTLGWR